jgi:hypothetical protein
MLPSQQPGSKEREREIQERSRDKIPFNVTSPVTYFLQPGNTQLKWVLSYNLINGLIH